MTKAAKDVRQMKEELVGWSRLAYQAKMRGERARATEYYIAAENLAKRIIRFQKEMR